MNIYVVRANDLATYMKINTENKILNLKKSSTEDDCLLIGTYLYIITMTFHF